MAREEWGLFLQQRGKWICSYKKITLIVCFFNIVVSLYCIRLLSASLYIYSDSVSRNIVVYKPDQIRKMEESIQIQKAYKPVELMKWVKELEGEFSSKNVAVELPQHLKQRIVDEILERLRSLNSNSTGMAKERETVENWRKERLKEVKLVLVRGTSNSTIPHEEAGMLAKALESDWDAFSEEIGLWIPVNVTNEEHDDKPEGVEEFANISFSKDEILPGRPLQPECNAELHTDYGGDAVRWGLTHHKDSAADCCQACLDQAKSAKEGEKKCNIWVYCPSEFGCHSLDIYQHKHMECWLKYADKPKPTFKDRYPEWYRNSHPSAPVIVPWASGVVGA